MSLAKTTRYSGACVAVLILLGAGYLLGISELPRSSATEFESDATASVKNRDIPDALQRDVKTWHSPLLPVQEREAKPEQGHDSEAIGDENKHDTKQTLPTDQEAYFRIGRARTALFDAARRNFSALAGTKFYQPSITIDGKNAVIISEARKSYGSKPIWAVVVLKVEDGQWKRVSGKTSQSNDLSGLAIQALENGESLSPEFTLVSHRAAADYSTSTSTEFRTVASETDSGDSTIASLETIEAELQERYQAQMLALELELKEIASQDSLYRPVYVSREIQPFVAENGTIYGEYSQRTGRPKTIHVGGYFRRDGTYVRSHFRSPPRR